MEKIDLSSSPIKKQLTVITNKINSNYNSDSLIKIGTYVKNFLTNNLHFFVENSGIFTLQNELKDKKSNKTLKAKIFSYIFLEKEIFDNFLQTFPTDVKKIFAYLTFHREAYLNKIENILKIKTLIIKKSSYYSNSYDIPDAYYLFSPEKVYGNDYLFLSFKSEFLSILQEFFPKPDDYNLLPLETIPDNYLIFNDNDAIFTNIDSLFSYFSINSNLLDIDKKITNAQASKLMKIFNINEFFKTEDKDINSLLTNMLVRFVILNLEKKNNLLLSKHVLIKNWITDIKSGKFKFIKALFLFNTSTTNASYNSKDADFFSNYFSIFKTIEIGKWISYSNFYNSLAYKGNHFKLVAYEYLYGMGYPKSTNTVSLKKIDAKPITNDTYEVAIIHQSIKALIFLFAALNVLEIAYNIPDLHAIGESCYSPYDELAYFKITPFGAYCLDINKDYEPLITIKEKPFELDSDNLFIRLLENSNAADEIVLKEVGTKISYNRYKVTPESFMKSCDNEQKIKDKIKFFETFVDKNPPEIWRKFFKTINNNINPLIKVNNVIVFRISESNKDLINLIATNQILRKMVIIAEGYKIIVNGKDVPTFKSKLKEFGYFME